MTSVCPALPLAAVIGWQVLQSFEGQLQCLIDLHDRLLVQYQLDLDFVDAVVAAVEAHPDGSRPEPFKPAYAAPAAVAAPATRTATTPAAAAPARILRMVKQ